MVCAKIIWEELLHQADNSALRPSLVLIIVLGIPNICQAEVTTQFSEESSRNWSEMECYTTDFGKISAQPLNEPRCMQRRYGAVRSVVMACSCFLSWPFAWTSVGDSRVISAPIPGSHHGNSLNLWLHAWMLEMCLHSGKRSPLQLWSKQR